MRIHTEDILYICLAKRGCTIYIARQGKIEEMHCKESLSDLYECLAGRGFEFILNYAGKLGLDKDTSGSWCSLILILLSVILTGCNLYSKIGKFGGAGGLVPITGFANSVAASAIEYKAEGQVFGIGCKIFTIAGPVILYGILSSWILGVIYYLFKLTGGLI